MRLCVRRHLTDGKKKQGLNILVNIADLGIAYPN